MSGRFAIPTGQMIFCIVMGVMALAGVIAAWYIVHDIDDLGNNSKKKGDTPPLRLILYPLSVALSASIMNAENPARDGARIGFVQTGRGEVNNG